MSTLEARQQNKTHRARPRPPFQQIALVLQGGGALGAYQAGVYEALAEADLHPDWVAGISIGAINTALIAGNAPQARVDKLKEFWESVTTPFWQGAERNADQLLPNADVVRSYMNRISAAFAPCLGCTGFFHAASLRALVGAGGNAFRDELLRHDSAASNVGAAGGFRSDQCRRDAVQRRFGECTHWQFRLFRYKHSHHPAGARACKRCVAAGCPASRDSR